MNIKPDDTTIKQLLLSGKQFIIPRFQREYSWEKKNYQEFIEDMTSCISVNSGTITWNQYFLGTMLFIGNISEGTTTEISVVDGQQRLTTITILFSALSERFKEIGEQEIREQLFRYVMTRDDDGLPVRILKSKSHYPFFAYYIQDLDKSNSTEPNSEEEICIKETYEYFYDILSEKKIKSLLKKNIGVDIVDALKYVDILKTLRDQVLNSTIISISSTDKDQANKIFEILNAKGKRLAHIDLIKNKIFELLNTTEPADFAEECWKQIRETLYSGKDSIGFATFYRHYWISKFKKSSSTKLYDDFLKEAVSKNAHSCKTFVEDMLKNAKYYVQILNPNLSYYNNRKEYMWLVQSLKALTNDFNIVQVRIALLALFDVKERNLISTKTFKETIIYLENFHFAYNSVLSLRSNRLEKIYSSFSIALRKCSTKPECNNIIKEKLLVQLEKIYPKESAFCEKFAELSFSKKENSSNIKTRYAVNKLSCYYAGKEIFEVDGSIEHLLPESIGRVALNIGNLILLEGNINNEAGEKPYSDKIELYKKSQYKWIQEFIKENDNWNESMIEDRATMMAETYYHFILERK